jgi:mannosylglycerate hydrolase
MEPINPELLDWYREQDEVIFDVVPHSHLDYAWYRDRESSKMREIEAFVKTVKVDKFTLEQMITAKEFVEGGGKQVKQDLLDMVAEGRMELIGMYSQPDVFLSPQELEFWNFEFGEKVAREQLGGEPSPDKYLPDTFGQPDTAPMVAVHAGKRSIISMRGFEHDWPVFMWQSPDGSRIPTFMIPGGYANAGHLTEVHDVDRTAVSPEEYYGMQVDHATIAVRSLINRYGHRYKKIGLPHMLLMNGNDFTQPDQDLPEVLEGVQEKIRQDYGIKNFQIRSSSLGRYVDLALRTINSGNLMTYQGEMRHGKEHYVLRGIDSARMYLKQRMHEVETRIYEAGTLASLLLLADKKCLIDYSKTNHEPWQQNIAYQRAIEQLLPVGSHDTISGCGSDDAYPLPLSLMTGSFNSANQAARNSIAALANRKDTYGAWQHKERGQTFANLLPHERTMLVELPMEGELEHDRGLNAVVTYADGRTATYPTQIIQRADTRYAICAVPMSGMSSVQVRLESTNGKPFEKLSPETSTFETDIYTVDVLPNGTLNILDKRTGTRLQGLVFEDQGDRGDEYTFCPPDDDEVRTTNDSQAMVTVVNDGPVFTDIEITTSLSVPDGLDGPLGTVRAARRRSETMVTVPITTRMRLFKDKSIDRIEFATTVDNTARDHRMRVLFDTPNAVDTVRAKEPYGMTTRSAVPIPGGEGWVEPLPVATSHAQGIVTAGDLALYSRGLPEYEAFATDDGTINQVALTLLRSVGYLSRGDQGSELQTRPGWAGPGYATPEAQMIGKHTFEYAINLNGQYAAGDVIAESKDYFHKAEHGFAGADINKLFRVEMSRNVEMPALRPTADGQAVLARFSNPNDDPVTIKLSGKFTSAESVDASGEKVLNDDDMHEFVLQRGIVTVRLS